MKCPNCNTENGYVRYDTKEWVCRKCATISPVVIKEIAKEQKEETKEELK